MGERIVYQPDNDVVMHKLALILVVVGGLNWLLLGVLQWEVGSLFGGSSAAISRVIYVVIGLAALYELFTHKKNCKSCESKMGGEMKM